jgi:hypothetical protein
MAVQQTLVAVSALGGSLRIGWVDGSMDVVWFEIGDAEGRYAVVCIDGREESRTRYRLFEGARHPDKPGAVLIALGSEEEGTVVPLLSSWLDDPDSKAVPVPIRPEAKERLIQWLLHLGEPSLGGE